MNEPDDPSRLFDAPSTPEGLKTVLRNAQADVGNDAQVARLAKRLGPLLGVGVAAGGGAAAGAKAAALSGGVKLGLAGLALAAVGGGVLWFSSPAAPPAKTPSPSAVAVAASEAAPPVAADPAPAATPSAATAPEPAPSAPSLEKPSAPAQLSEVELLEQARQSLKSDPSRALQRANEHARRFPRGVLVQEREVLAIQALRRLGRDAEADRRTEAFSKAFPGSAFQRSLKPGP